MILEMPEEQERVTITVGMTTAQITLSLMARDIIDQNAEGTPYLHPHVAKFYLAALNALAQKEDGMGGVMRDDVLAAKAQCEQQLASGLEEEEAELE